MKKNRRIYYQCNSSMIDKTTTAGICYQHNSFVCIKDTTAGLTLVALVVTIVVLLILAGITITYALGDNSVFKQAADAKLQTELAKIEERAGLIYSDKLLEKVSTDLNSKPTLKEIVEELRKEKYTIEQVTVNDNQITGISLDRESMSIGKGKTNTIQVTLEGSNSPYIYYVLVEGKYYKMNFNNGLIEIERTPSEIAKEEGEKITLTAASADETIAIAITNNDTNTVAITAKEKSGTVKITVTYGEYSKTCDVKVCEVTTELEISSIRARIATGATRWLNAVAKPEATASQEFEWSSSDESVATVNNKGVITTKKKGTATITVKTEDGSNLSKTCKVTVDDGVDVATLTEIQTGEKNIIAKDSNGNLITVPIGFRVLTSEGTKVTDGIVIQDEDLNEFVWVPVDSVSTGTEKPADDIRLGRYEDFTKKNSLGNYIPKQDADNYEEKVMIQNWQELVKGYPSAKDLGDFVNKTQSSGGYYFARYEAGQGTNGKAVSQANKRAWTNITYSNSVKLSREMYNNNYVESDLINSYSWDTALIFIQKYSGIENYANSRDSSIVCNITNMAYGCYEFSTESGTKDYPYSSRGAECNSNSALSRYGRKSSDEYNFLSFRPIIYVK